MRTLQRIRLQRAPPHCGSPRTTAQTQTCSRQSFDVRANCVGPSSTNRRQCAPFSDAHQSPLSWSSLLPAAAPNRDLPKRARSFYTRRAVRLLTLLVMG